MNRFNQNPQKGNLTKPTFCNVCHSNNITLELNSVIYGREFGDYPFIYLCNDCRSYVGLHPNTSSPLGTLADEETRQARNIIKKRFISWYKFNGYSRGKAYKDLSKMMGISQRECHFGWFCLSALKEVDRLMKLEGF